jgi:hypothetical protein
MLLFRFFKLFKSKKKNSIGYFCGIHEATKNGRTALDCENNAKPKNW